MKPAMEASILEAMGRLIYLEDVKEIRAIQAGIKMTQAWLQFPGQKHEEVKDEAEFEKAMNETSKEDSDKGQTSEQ